MTVSKQDTITVAVEFGFGKPFVDEEVPDGSAPLISTPRNAGPMVRKFGAAFGFSIGREIFHRCDLSHPFLPVSAIVWSKGEEVRPWKAS